MTKSRKGKTRQAVNAAAGVARSMGAPNLPPAVVDLIAKGINSVAGKKKKKAPRVRQTPSTGPRTLVSKSTMPLSTSVSRMTTPAPPSSWSGRMQLATGFTGYSDQTTLAYEIPIAPFDTTSEDIQLGQWARPVDRRARAVSSTYREWRVRTAKIIVTSAAATTDPAMLLVAVTPATQERLEDITDWVGGTQCTLELPVYKQATVDITKHVSTPWLKSWDSTYAGPFECVNESATSDPSEVAGTAAYIKNKISLGFRGAQPNGNSNVTVELEVTFDFRSPRAPGPNAISMNTVFSNSNALNYIPGNPDYDYLAFAGAGLNCCGSKMKLNNTDYGVLAFTMPCSTSGKQWIITITKIHTASGAETSLTGYFDALIPYEAAVTRAFSYQTHEVNDPGAVPYTITSCAVEYDPSLNPNGRNEIALCLYNAGISTDYVPTSVNATRMPTAAGVNNGVMCMCLPSPPVFSTALSTTTDFVLPSVP